MMMMFQVFSALAGSRHLSRGDLLRLGATCRENRELAAAALRERDFAAAARICGAARRWMDTAAARLVLEARAIVERSAAPLDGRPYQSAKWRDIARYAAHRGWAYLHLADHHEDTEDIALLKSAALPGGYRLDLTVISLWDNNGVDGVNQVALELVRGDFDVASYTLTYDLAGNYLVLQYDPLPRDHPAHDTEAELMSLVGALFDPADVTLYV